MLLINTDKKIFNTAEIRRGTLVYARKAAWDEGITGFVTEASETAFRLQFLPSIQNVLNHCVITAEEVSEGLWTLRYSSDGLQTVQEYVPEDTTGTEGQEETEETDGSEPADI